MKIIKYLLCSLIILILSAYASISDPRSTVSSALGCSVDYSKLYNLNNNVSAEYLPTDNEINSLTKFQYSSIAEAQAQNLDTDVFNIIVNGKLYKKVESNPFHSRSFFHPNGNYYSSVKMPATGLPMVHLAIGQSNILDTTGTPGGDRSVKDGVLVLELYPRENRPSGLIVAGPEDPAWPLRNTDTSNVANSTVYQFASHMYHITGRLQIVLIHGSGGTPLSDFLPAGGGVIGATGSVWASLQKSWKALLDIEIPGRGKTLPDYGITAAHYLHFSHGEADANYKNYISISGHTNRPGFNERYSTGNQYLARLRNLFNKLKSPPGSSIPVIDGNTRILIYELIRGGTNRGAPNVGYSTDDRNNELSKVHLSKSINLSVRRNIKFVKSGGLNKHTANGEEIGTSDNLHHNGAGIVERALIALKTDQTPDHCLFIYRQMKKYIN